MKRIFNFVILVLFSESLLAQGGFPDYLTKNTYLNNYVQPAPNAAALGKYVDYPVSYYTGLPEISIPLYDLKDGAAHMSISLSYHASGIRVGECASWMGLGWVLNAGGMIMRTVRGAPDEGSGKSWGGAGPGPRGYYIDYGLSLLPMLPYPGFIGHGLNTYPMDAIAVGYMDSEPDLFFFNFNGMTGKFVFDETRTPRLLTDDNIKITPIYNGTTFISWVFTTADGTKYYFGENNTYEVTQPSSYLNSGLVDSRSNYPSNWYLTRVVYPNTKDTIYLNYTAEKYMYRDLPPEGTTYHSDQLQNACINLIPPTDALQTTVNGYRLTSIKSKNYTVTLAAHTQRTDMSPVYASPVPYMLDSLNVYTSAGLGVKRWVMGHSYFTSAFGSTASRISNLMGLLKDTTDCRRLKLTALTEYSGDGSIAKPGYVFNYYDSIALPRRLSYDQDHWGFSNNHTGSSNQFATPAVSHSICTTGSFGANRTPKWPDMESFTMSSMVDPLGVRTKFTFEAHAIDIGGLRIKKIETVDSVTGMVSTRSFTYGGATLYQIPQYLIVPNNEFYLTSNMAALQGVTFYQGYRPLGPYYVIRDIIKQSQSIMPLQDAQGNHVGYGSVKETFGSRGEGGSKIYTYYTVGSENGNSRLDMSNYTNYNTYRTYEGGYVTGLSGNGRFNGIAPDSLVYHMGYSGVPYYPFTPSQMLFDRGRLGAEALYDSTGLLIHNVAYSFADSLHENYLIRGLKTLRTPNTYNSSTNDAFSFYKLHTGISHIVSEVVTDYKDGKTMTATTNFAYESPYHTLKTSETSYNSIGDTIIKKTYYSFDYANAASPDNVFAKMAARNMLLPVATRVWKNSHLISGTVTQFKDFANWGTDTFINPVKIYSMETNVPLTTAQAGEGMSFTGRFTSLLPDSNFVEKADFNYSGTSGRVIEQNLINDKHQSVIWDNQLFLPLAQVDNAVFTDVAYSSFETAETGNWGFFAGNLTSDATAPTGAHAYSLDATHPISKSGMNSSRTYVFSYWLKSAASISISGGTQSGSVTGRVLNGWTYHEIKITGTSSISITGTGNVDEVRLYPSAAQMTTYCYDSLLRLISTCSANSTVSYYEYDPMNRLTDIKDQFGNILKAYEYNYGRSSR